MKNLEIGKNPNVYPTKKFRKKLNVEDYVFEIDNKDIIQVEVSYYFDRMSVIKFKDGKKYEETFTPLICIELHGIEQSSQNEAWIDFSLNIDTETLNELSDVPTDISKYIVLGELFIKRPNENTSEFLDFVFAENTINDIYRSLSSIFISKIDKNVFIIKLSIFNEVFTYFKIDFNN